MNKSSRSEAFGEQMAQAMAELRAIMSSGKSPTGDGRLTIRTIEVSEPSTYDARKVRKVRAALNVSQAVFARLIGVSDVLVRSCGSAEHGNRPRSHGGCSIKFARTRRSLCTSSMRR